MFIDASAIVAILAREPQAGQLKKAIDVAKPPLYVSSLVVFEASVSLARAKLRSKRTKRHPTPTEIRASQAVVEALINANGIKDIVISADIGRGAVEAAATYGKAIGHQADLNFGDCFAYACAKAYGVPLLYIGNDFAKTDLA
jgi:ribonuclease VapC